MVFYIHAQSLVPSFTLRRKGKSLKILFTVYPVDFLDTAIFHNHVSTLMSLETVKYGYIAGHVQTQ